MGQKKGFKHGERAKELEEKGYRVLRLWEHEINKLNLEEFTEVIY